MELVLNSQQREINVKLISPVLYFNGTCNSVVGWGTLLQAEGHGFESQ